MTYFLMTDDTTDEITAAQARDLIDGNHHIICHEQPGEVYICARHMEEKEEAYDEA